MDCRSSLFYVRRHVCPSTTRRPPPCGTLSGRLPLLTLPAEESECRLTFLFPSLFSSPSPPLSPLPFLLSFLLSPTFLSHLAPHLSFSPPTPFPLLSPPFTHLSSSSHLPPLTLLLQPADFGIGVLARFPVVQHALNSPPHTNSRPIWANTSMLPAQPVQGNEQYKEGGGWRRMKGMGERKEWVE